MLEEPGAASAFGVRIELAFLLGLISARERGMLNLIRKIRNSFAHLSKRVSFSHSCIKDRCLALDVTKHPERESGKNKPYDLRNPMDKFCAAFTFLLLVLSYRTDQLEHRAKTKSITEDDIDSTLKAVRAHRAQRSQSHPTKEQSGESE
jgi:hypothetical protein